MSQPHSGDTENSMDLSEFTQEFFAEASEHLATMEQLLLAMDMSAPSDEDLNAIFRAAHSIKGGGAMFGFTDLTHLTHELESLLDKVRKHETVLTAEMLDVLLEAGDMTRLLLARYSGESTTEAPPIEALCQKIKGFVDQQSMTAITESATVKPTAAKVEVATTIANVKHSCYRVSFPFPELSSPQLSLKDIYAELRTIGTVTELPATTPGRISVLVETGVGEDEVFGTLAFMLPPEKIDVVLEKYPPSTEGQTDTALDDGFFYELMQAIIPSEISAKESPDNPGRRATDRRDAAENKGRRESDKAATGASSEQLSIRVNIEKVDQLINQMGELVIIQAMLAQSASQLDPLLYQGLFKCMADLERNTRDLQESVMSVRMTPVSAVFNRCPRLVRDLAGKLGKRIQVVMEGESTELDKGLIEKISDPLTHLVRNSVDHGIELPEKRIAAGKPELGTLTLRAAHQGGNIVIEVCDDGAGLSREKILAKARERGLVTNDTMSDSEVWQLIFEAGFSTAEVVTDVSGRGVGMDVVKRNIQALGGRVEIDSTLGIGTRMSIRLPLTLAILDGLSVAVGDQIFIVPLNSIVESLQPKTEDVRSIGSQGMVVQVRGEYVPVVMLHELLNILTEAVVIERGIMVILESDGVKKALFVDRLLGQHQVVIKSLEANYRQVHGISGATIMGDGRVALIIDVGAVVRSVTGEKLGVAILN
jgi:two-component system chemotaxis sensor kinase CheA